MRKMTSYHMNPLRVSGWTLQVPTVHYRRSDCLINAYGMVHVASAEFYAQRQIDIDAHDHGLYEGVKSSINLENLSVEKRKYVQKFKQLMENYSHLADGLSLETQKDSLAYGKNWSNPDTDLETMISSASLDGLNLLDVYPEHMQNMVDDLQALGKENPKLPARLVMQGFRPSVRFLLSLFSWKQRGANREFMRSIMDERNTLLFKGIEQKMQETDELGIVYGAGHFSGLDKYLRKNGFKHEGTQWDIAWDAR